MYITYICYELILRKYEMMIKKLSAILSNSYIMNKTIIQLGIICKNIILSFIIQANRKR